MKNGRRFTLNVAYYTIPSVYGASHVMTLHKPLHYSQRWLLFTIYLGLYLLLEEDYDSALETFNAVFELDPSYDYTHLNRGLNFYYVERYILLKTI